MGKILFRDVISVFIIAAMVMTASVIPVFNHENAYASSYGDTLKTTAVANVKKMLDSESNGEIKAPTQVSSLSNTVKLDTTTKKTNTSFRVYTTSKGYPEEIVSGEKFYVPGLFVITKKGQSDITTEITEKLLEDEYIDLKTKYAGANTLNVYFVEMYYDANATADDDVMVSTGNIDIVKVNFDAQGKISFNKNKGKFKTSSSAKWVKNGAKYGTLPKMKTRKGYSFAGWYTAKSAGKKVKSSSTVNIVKDTTLYAQWKYKVTLNANKGKVGGKKTATKSVVSGNKYGSLKTPKRSGYNFAGWYTKKSGGKWVNKSTYNTNASKHTLYAHWVKKSSYATKSQYKAVKTGMTYSEVKRIFGRAGTYAAAYSGDGYKNYVWLAKKNNSGAVVLFVNGKVDSKAWV